MKIKQTLYFYLFFVRQSAAQQRFIVKIKTWKKNCVNTPPPKNIFFLTILFFLLLVVLSH